MKILKGALASRLKKLKRHKNTILPHITPRKLFNALRVEMDFKKGRDKVKGNPYWVKIETSRVCNLNCPGCYAHGSEIDPSYPDEKKTKRFMALEEFKTVLDQVKRTAFAVQLYDEGEPLLNPEIFDIIRYARKSNVGTVISSNFSMVLKDNDFEELVHAGLDHIVIGIDGSTQEIYEQTRVGGNLERVIDNTKKLMETKKRLKQKRPSVEIQFVQKPFNMHEMTTVEALAHQLGADVFTPVRLGVFWVEADPTPPPPQKKCPIPWSSMVVQWNGDVSVCPLSDSPDLITSANALKQPVKELYNNQYYQNLRTQHAAMNNGGPQHIQAQICMQCDFNR